jgi:mRNA-degrading endonuclease RelE of RelBE toxin-antitoxin system
MTHRANADFWHDYQKLTPEIRVRADKQFALLKTNPRHPSLQFKKIGERNGQEIWSARVSLKYRVLAVRLADEYLWLWIGEHNVYDAFLT